MNLKWNRVSSTLVSVSDRFVIGMTGITLSSFLLGMGLWRQGMFYDRSFLSSALICIVAAAVLLVMQGRDQTLFSLKEWAPLLFPWLAAGIYGIHLWLEPASVHGSWMQGIRWSAYGAWIIVLLVSIRMLRETGVRLWQVVMTGIGWFLSGSAMLMLYGWLPYAGGVMVSSDAELSALGFRLAGWLQYPNVLGALAGAFALYAADGLRKASTPAAWGVAGASLLLHGCVLMLTESRGAWLAVALVAAARIVTCGWSGVRAYGWTVWFGAWAVLAAAASARGWLQGAGWLSLPLLASMAASLWLPQVLCKRRVAEQAQVWCGRRAAGQAQVWCGRRAAEWAQVWCGRRAAERAQVLCRRRAAGRAQVWWGRRAAERAQVWWGRRAAGQAQVQDRRRQPVWLGMLIALVLCTAWLLLPEQAGSRISGGHYETVSARSLFYQDALQLWKAHPLLGSGGDAWRQQFASIQSEPYVGKEVHSSVADLLLDIGLVGTLPVVMLAFYALLRAWRLNPGAGMAAAVLLGHSVVDFDYAYAVTVLITLGWLVFGWVAQPLSCSDQSSRLKGMWRYSNALLVLLLLIPLAVGLRYVGAYALSDAGMPASALRFAPWDTALRIAAARQQPPQEALALLREGQRYERSGSMLHRELALTAEHAGLPREAAAYWEAAMANDRFDKELRTEAVVKLVGMAQSAADRGQAALALELAQAATEHFDQYRAEVLRIAEMPHVANDKQFAITVEAERAVASARLLLVNGDI